MLLSDHALRGLRGTNRSQQLAASMRRLDRVYPVEANGLVMSVTEGVLPLAGSRLEEGDVDGA